MSLLDYAREHDEPVPINDTWLSGKPYYCDICGLGMAEFLACEEGDCCLETEETARARLRKAHAEGKGMLPCTMGVGCDESGVCYAEAHGQPEMCPRLATAPSPSGDALELLATACKLPPDQMRSAKTVRVDDALRAIEAALTRSQHPLASGDDELAKQLEQAAHEIREHVPDDRHAFKPVAVDRDDPERATVAGPLHAELLERAAQRLRSLPIAPEWPARYGARDDCVLDSFGGQHSFRVVPVMGQKPGEIVPVVVAALNRRVAPEGYVMVPREPTEAMQRASVAIMPDSHPLAYWQAMLSAAPQPPLSGVSDGQE